jgi:hypothetical protein
VRRGIVVAAAAIACVIAAALSAGCSMSADSKLAEEAVPEFHRLLDGAKFDAIYDGSSDELKQAATRKDFVDLLAAVHRKLGTSGTSNQLNWNVNYNVSGAYVTLAYQTAYAEGDATEQFVYHLEQGRALLAGYHVNSNALILK